MEDRKVGIKRITNFDGIWYMQESFRERLVLFTGMSAKVPLIGSWSDHSYLRLYVAYGFSG